jgi:hypothetical protein
MKILVRAATALGRSARKQRNSFGTEITHCRTGTGGMTRSTRCAAVCAIRWPLQDGQTPWPLHEKAARSVFRDRQRNSGFLRRCEGNLQSAGRSIPSISVLRTPRSHGPSTSPSRISRSTSCSGVDRPRLKVVLPMGTTSSIRPRRSSPAWPAMRATAGRVRLTRTVASVLSRHESVAVDAAQFINALARSHLDTLSGVETGVPSLMNGQLSTLPELLSL